MAEKPGYTLLSCLVVFVSFGCLQCINLDLDDSKDGFFLKSPYHKLRISEPNVVKESLILTHPAEVYKLRASHGPFEMYEVVPNKVLANILKFDETSDIETDMHRHIIHNMDVSAHLVSRKVSYSNPLVQVLVHVSIARKQKQEFNNVYYVYSQRWCAQIFLTRGNEQYTSVCVLNGDSNACVASLAIPEHWWDTSNTSVFDQDVQVFYDLSRVEQSQECASVSNTIVPARVEAQSINKEKKLISTFKLKQENYSYEEHRDKDLIFRIPKTDLLPNSKFEVPVLLEKNSALKEFVVQVKIRGNIAVEGAYTAKDGPWSLKFESEGKDGTSTVTIFQKQDVKNTKTTKVDEIMRWQFRVLSSTSSTSAARIVWNVDYEKNGLSRNAFFNPEGSRIVAKFTIVNGKTDHIVTVLKERNILNTAILTGTALTHDMLVYSVSYNNTFKEITTDCTCRSSDYEALQVSSSCENIFLNGTETRGAKNVTIIVRTADQIALVGVRVWVPDPRLDIQLSDIKLSQVRGWKVNKPKHISKRSVDLGLLTHSRVIMGNESEQADSPTCRNKYQQSLIDVFAKFTINVPGEATLYYRNKKTAFKVTKFVMDRLKVKNTNIATIVRDSVIGLSPGVTEIQVTSASGKILGTREIKVGEDKIAIERMMVRVVSGMKLHISEDKNIPGALLATVYLRDQLNSKSQEALLDIDIEFKDGTTLPLSSVDPEEYELVVTSVNTDIVEVTKQHFTEANFPPSIRAVGNGKGEIVKVILRETKACTKKKPRTLDAEYVHVQVEFTKDMDNYNAAIQSDVNVNDHHSEIMSKDEFFSLKHQESKFIKPAPKVSPVDKFDTHTLPDVDDDEMTQEPKSEALEQPVSTKVKHPSPLEIGMYVLVAVFVFAILVFTANCAVFMVRYQRKRSPKNSRIMTGSISQAPDWVWIGRATLERHGAANAGCNHALMAEEDFNGNQMVVPNALPTERHRHSARRPVSNELNDSKSTSGVTGSVTAGSESNRSSMVSTYKGSECSIRITSNPLPDNDCGMGYNEAEWDYEAMGMTYEQLMEYFDNLKESSA